ncbi:MAG: hypothetical protein R3E77_10090 [Steroidobacteraceae bacterium]
MTRVDVPWFEDLPPGEEFDAPAVTLTTGQSALYQAITGDRLRLALDHGAARAVTGAAEPLAHPLLAINMAIGQTTWATQRVKANLFYRGLTLMKTVCLGDSLYTRTRVIAAHRNQLREQREATGLVALEITTRNQRNETVLHFWRCAMVACRDRLPTEGGTGNEIERVGRDFDVTLPERIAADYASRWQVAAWASGLSGRRAAQFAPGETMSLTPRDTVSLAPELVRLTLNLAMTHTDAGASYLGERLVYGGHVIALAFAQLTRLMPNLLTLISWDECSHTAPVLEGDRLRSEARVLESKQIGDLALQRIRVVSYAARGTIQHESEQQALDWTLTALSL